MGTIVDLGDYCIQIFHLRRYIVILLLIKDILFSYILAIKNDLLVLLLLLDNGKCKTVNGIPHFQNFLKKGGGRQL